MNTRGETTTFITITAAAFIIIGLLFVVFSQHAGVTGKTTTGSICAEVVDGKEVFMPIEECCAEIRKSIGCENKGDLFECTGTRTILVDEKTIRSCQ